jgi:protein TonB
MRTQIILILVVLATTVFGAAAPVAGDSPPVVRFQVRPHYPKELAEQKKEGEVLVEFFVEKDGSVNDARVLRQTNAAFGKAAVECVKRWKFDPALKAGTPVRARMQVPLVFEMDKPNQGPTRR